MGNGAVLITLIGVVAGLAGYYTYTRSGLLSAVIVTVAVGGLIHRFSSSEKAWGTFGLLANPATSGLLFFSGGFVYFSLGGKPFDVSLAYSIGTGFLGAVMGMVFYKYWQP